MMPTASSIQAPQPAMLPEPPKSWSALSWAQLCAVWQCKMRYGGNADVAQAAALLSLYGLEPSLERREYDPVTGEAVYTLCDSDGYLWTVTPRELSQMAQTMKWFHYPYGDRGKEAVKDDKGKVIEEAVAPVRGYVNPDWRGDAMALPEETIVVCGQRFQLPSVACYNITWQQYRSLQALAPLLFQEGMSDNDVIDLHAQFLAHSVVPAKDGQQTSDRFAPPHDFTYNADRAEQSVAFWRERLKKETTAEENYSLNRSVHSSLPSVLFNIVFQVYQTALSYYEQAFPLLFNGGGKNDLMQDALTGETKTLNAVMKYQGYTKPEDVYAENLPVILSTLNTMAEEAKQIEQVNARTRRKR